jgi:hypothetical protein
VKRFVGDEYRQHDPHSPGDHDDAGIDILRLDEDGRIVEHRNVLRAILADAANTDDMFRSVAAEAGRAFHRIFAPGPVLAAWRSGRGNKARHAILAAKPLGQRRRR